MQRALITGITGPLASLNNTDLIYPLYGGQHLSNGNFIFH